MRSDAHANMARRRAAWTNCRFMCKISSFTYAPYSLYACPHTLMPMTNINSEPQGHTEGTLREPRGNPQGTPREVII